MFALLLKSWPKEMEYLHRVLLKTTTQTFKESEKKQATHMVHLDSGLEVKRKFHLCPYVPGLSRNLEESFDIPVYRSSSKEPTPLNLSLHTLKIKIWLQLGKT